MNLPGKVPGHDRMPGIISASLLAADGAALGEEAALALSSGADWLHFDLMVLAHFLASCCSELSARIGGQRGGAVGLRSLCLRWRPALHRWQAQSGGRLGARCHSLVHAGAVLTSAARPGHSGCAACRTGTLSTTGRLVPVWWALCGGL